MNQDRKIEAYHRQLSRSTLLAKMVQTETFSGESEYTYADQDILGMAVDHVLAPALNGFVVWVLHQALEKHIERLYFLARDGYFMYQTAREYVKAYNIPIECRYLYCSRYSVRVPSYHLDEEKALSYITLGGLNVTVEGIYQRAGLHEEQREKLYQEKILPYGKNVRIPKRELGKVQDKLRRNEVFMELMRENSRRALPAFEQYLQQEGLMDKVIIALVDSGWVGSMQKELELSLRRLGRKEPLVGFYWGLYEIPADMDRDFYHTYFFSPEGEIGRKAVFNNCLFETIYTAPHGMTLYYQKCGKKIEPVLSEMKMERKKRILDIESRFAQWQERFLQHRRKESFQNLIDDWEEKLTFQTIAKNLKMFMHHPTKEEAQVFGKMDFTDDMLEREGTCIAAKSTIRYSAWYEGSVSAVAKYPGWRITQYVVYKYLLYYRMKRRYIRREHKK